MAISGTHFKSRSCYNGRGLSRECHRKAECTSDQRGNLEFRGLDKINLLGIEKTTISPLHPQLDN